MNNTFLFRARLAMKRKGLKLTQAELGRRASVPRDSISRFETGDRLPSFENLVKLADGLKVSVDYLCDTGTQPDKSFACMFNRLSVGDQEVVVDLMKALRGARTRYGR